MGTDENKFCLQVETAVAGAGISTETAPGMKKGLALLDVGDEGGNWTTLSTNFKPTQEERQAKQDTETKEMVDNLVNLASFVEIGAKNWTTYSTNFKPTKEERQAKQDSKTKEMVDNLVNLANFMEVGAENSTTYSTNFKPTEEERQAKQDAVTKQDVQNLVTLMND